MFGLKDKKRKHLVLVLLTPLTLFAIPQSENVRGEIVDRNGIVLAEGGRNYHYAKSLSHIVGYASFESNSSGGVGKSGLEKVYNDELSQGKKIKTTIDVRVQEDIYELFKNKEGAVIVMDSRNGAILNGVSFPAFDANSLSSGITHTEWTYLNENPKEPFTNKMINSLFPLGRYLVYYATPQLLEKFEFGEKTGIDLPNEFHGTDSYNFLPSRSLNLATPIQIAKMGVALATGRIVVPHINQNMEYETQKIKVSKDFIKLYVRHDKAVVLGNKLLTGMKIKLKTIHPNSDTYWINAYYPRREPKYMITLYLENIDGFAEIDKEVMRIVDILDKYGYVDLKRTN